MLVALLLGSIDGIAESLASRRVNFVVGGLLLSRVNMLGSIDGILVASIFG